MKTQKVVKVVAETLKVNDVILPPAREIRLWMKAELLKRNLPKEALYMTIQDVKYGGEDKRGPWLLVVATLSSIWRDGRPSHGWSIRIRPGTLWLKVVEEAIAV